MKSRLLLALLAVAPVVGGQPGEDGWRNTVRDSPAYQQMPPELACAKSCINDVTSVTPCTVATCVCSGHTGGTYYIQGSNYITTCARQQCSDPSAAEIAAQVFNDICNEYGGTTATTTAPPASSPTAMPKTSSIPAVLPAATPAFLLIRDEKYPHKYDHLQPCSKFVLNSCRDKTLAIVEKDCFQIQYYPSGRWSEWYGLGNATGCSDAACLCQAGPFNSTTGYFNITFHEIFDAAAAYCSLKPTISVDDPSPEFERLTGVVADFCVDSGFRADGWYLGLPIAPIVASNGTASNNTKSNDTPAGPLLSAGEIITLVPTLFVSLVTLIFQIVQIVLSWPGYRVAKRELKANQGRPNSDEQAAPMETQAAGPPPLRPESAKWG